MMGFFNYFNKKEKIPQKVTRQEAVDFSFFKKVTDFIYERSGITDLDKRAFTASRIQQYVKSQNIFTTNKLLETMQSDQNFYQEIINIATVNETFFMREVKELHWLVEYIKSTQGNLKILSIPCSSGEEIYSTLLLLLQEGVDISRVSMTGYDINSVTIADAKKGIYDEHSLHKIDAHLRKKYFHVVDNLFEIDLSLRKHPSFLQKNIFDLNNENEQYDIVLSRNMFIYFDDIKREKALENILSVLKTGGIYIKGHADQIKKHQNLANVEYGIYKKV